MNIISAQLSKPGARRNNEDCIGSVRTEVYSCYIVADGLGGHAAGEVASKLCVDCLLSYFETVKEIDADVISRGLELAQEALLKKQQSDIRLSDMRTTASVLVTNGIDLYLAYAGDSRFYRFFNNKVVFQSPDHSVPQRLYEGGLISMDEIRHHEDRNRLLRVMGSPEKFRPEILRMEKPPEIGDRYLLCTDGFWELVDEGEMEDALALCPTPRDWLTKIERMITARLKENSDNYSAVMIYLQP